MVVQGARGKAQSRPSRPSSIEQTPRPRSVLRCVFLSSGTVHSSYSTYRTAFYASPLSVLGEEGLFACFAKKKRIPSLQPRIPPLTALFGGCLLRFPHLQASSDVTRFQGYLKFTLPYAFSLLFGCFFAPFLFVLEDFWSKKAPRWWCPKLLVTLSTLHGFIFQTFIGCSFSPSLLCLFLLTFAFSCNTGGRACKS